MTHRLSRVTHRTRSLWPFLAALPFFISNLVWASLSNEPRPVDGRLIWIRESQIYIATHQPGFLIPGSTLTLRYRGKAVATAEVSRVHDAVIVTATLTSGSLDRVKRLDRVRILIETRTFDPLPTLRLGYPSAERPNMLFACEDLTLGPGAPPSIYRTELMDHNAMRMVRQTDASPNLPWPDTLWIRFFDQVSDQEIALERGELDAAIFWPGEPSRRVRANPSWWGDVYGTRSRGVLVATWRAGPDAGAIESDRRLAELNRQLFQGDLERLNPMVASSPDSQPQAGPRFLIEVDSAIPGRRLLERFLGRDVALHGRAVEIVYMDQAVALVNHDQPSTSGKQVLPLFAIRCPIVCTPELRPYIQALGADVLADLMHCSLKAPKP